MKKSTFALAASTVFFCICMAVATLIPAPAEASGCYRCFFTQDGGFCISSSFGRTDCFINQFGECQLGGTRCFN